MSQEEVIKFLMKLTKPVTCKYISERIGTGRSSVVTNLKRLIEQQRVEVIYKKEISQIIPFYYAILNEKITL